MNVHYKTVMEEIKTKIAELEEQLDRADNHGMMTYNIAKKIENLRQKLYSIENLQAKSLQ